MYIQFDFRIKGTHYYSAETLINSNIIKLNQSLSLNLEPSNPFDHHAVQVWLEAPNLPKAQRNLSLWKQLYHPALSPNPSSYAIIPRQAVSKRLHNLPSHLSNELSTNLHAQPLMPKMSQLRWHFQPHHWLLGYLPRDLANPIAANFQHKNFIPNQPLSYRLQVNAIGPHQKLYARLRMPFSCKLLIRLLSDYMHHKHHSDYQWKLKLASLNRAHLNK